MLFGPMGVVERIVEHSQRLTATERKIAEVLAGEPQTIAFGTVAQVARRAGTSGPSVVRLAVKLGYSGFIDMQADVQQELARQLGPARERIRQRPPSDLKERIATAEADNVSRTLAQVDEAALHRSVTQLSDRRHAVWILPGEVTYPVGVVLASHLAALREHVTLAWGSQVALSRCFAGFEASDTVVALDIRRYERSLLSFVEWATGQGGYLIAITDSPLSPLAGRCSDTFFIDAHGVGPFDSMTGGLALANLLVAAVAGRLRQSAASRLDRIEAAWNASHALVAASSAPMSATEPDDYLLSAPDPHSQVSQVSP